MSMPLVSVITPVYNGRDHLAACIKSVAKSVTCGRFMVEQIIVDDGSSDDSADVARRAVEALPRPLDRYYHFLALHPNSGKPAKARNLGIAAARGKYIFCLDHDDVLLQNGLRYLVEHLYTHNGSHVVYGDFIRASGDTLTYEIGEDYYGWTHGSVPQLLHSIFRGDHFYQHSLMFTKELWELAGGYDENITYGEDLDLCVRFILHGHQPAHLPVTTHVHRNHANNLTVHYEHKNEIWLAERRAHYHKYQSQLSAYLTIAQINDIEQQLEITPDVRLNGPPPNHRHAKITQA